MLFCTIPGFQNGRADNERNGPRATDAQRRQALTSIAARGRDGALSVPETRGELSRH